MKFSTMANGIGKMAGVVVEALLRNDACRAVKYHSHSLVVSAARPVYKAAGMKWSGRDSRADIVLKIGAPNFDERTFIKKCQKAGEPFPVKKIQLKFPPAKAGKK